MQNTPQHGNEAENSKTRLEELVQKKKKKRKKKKKTNTQATQGGQ
jgi:hypothetical protein